MNLTRMKQKKPCSHISSNKYYVGLFQIKTTSKNLYEVFCKKRRCARGKKSITSQEIIFLLAESVRIKNKASRTTLTEYISYSAYFVRTQNFKKNNWGKKY